MAGTNGTHNGHPSEQLVGRVLSVNERRLSPRGARRLAELLEVGRRADPAPTGQGHHPDPRQIGLRAVRRAGRGRATSPPEPRSGPETAIIRQTCLKASAEFCAARPDLRTADLFALAEKMEAWVNR